MRPWQGTSLGLPYFNLRCFGSKCTALKKRLATFPPKWFGARGIVPPLLRPWCDTSWQSVQLWNSQSPECRTTSPNWENTTTSVRQIYPECSTKDWWGKLCWLNPWESNPDVVRGPGGVIVSLNLRGPVLVWHWCTRRECKPPQQCWFGENPGKIPKNQAKSLKNFTNSLKIWAKMAPNMLWFEKNGAQNDMESFSLEVTFLVFLGEFGRIQAKILRNSKNLPGPTPMWCGTSGTIWNCCWPWGIPSSPMDIAPTTLPRGKAVWKWMKWITFTLVYSPVYKSAQQASEQVP